MRPTMRSLALLCPAAALHGMWGAWQGCVGPDGAPRVRDTAVNRDEFGDAMALVLEQYLYRYWGLTLGSAPPPSAR